MTAGKYTEGGKRPKRDSSGTKLKSGNARKRLLGSKPGGKILQRVKSCLLSQKTLKMAFKSLFEVLSSL